MESEAPHSVIVYTIPDDVLEQGRGEYQDLLIAYQECQRSGDWHGPADVEQVLTLPSWVYGADDECGGADPVHRPGWQRDGGPAVSHQQHCGNVSDATDRAVAGHMDDLDVRQSVWQVGGVFISLCQSFFSLGRQPLQLFLRQGFATLLLSQLLKFQIQLVQPFPAKYVDYKYKV